MTTKKTTTKASPRTRKATPRKASPATTTAKKKAAPRKPAGKKAAPKKAPATRPSSTSKGGVLDAAATVLKAASPKAMNCKQMMEAILKRSLWATKGATPAATLSSAILREVQRKGKQARFEKVGRGQFRLRKGA